MGMGYIGHQKRKPKIDTYQGSESKQNVNFTSTSPLNLSEIMLRGCSCQCLRAETPGPAPGVTGRRRRRELPGTTGRHREPTGGAGMTGKAPGGPNKARQVQFQAAGKHRALPGALAGAGRPGSSKSSPAARNEAPESKSGATLYYQGRLCTAGGDFVLPGVTLCSRARLCTTRGDFVLPGATLYYQGRLCTTRGHFVIPGATLYY
jgi:hypothetical protein